MRLIDADRLNEVIERNFCYPGCLNQIVDAQPTAYDVDRLEELGEPLPESYKEGQQPGGGCIALQNTEMADIEQAIAYFKDELAMINVFSDMVSFQEDERKSIEMALKVLQEVYEENQNRRQDGSR